MSSDKEVLMDEIEKSLWHLTEDNLRYLCECSGIDGPEVKGMNHRLLRRKVMEEMWTHTESMKSDEHGMSWLLRLMKNMRRILKGGCPIQGYDDEDDHTAYCDKTWDEAGVKLPCHRLKESAPERQSLAQNVNSVTIPNSVGMFLEPHAYLSGEKPHVCSECGKAFKMAGCLKRHLRTHTGEKPFVCPHCGKAWSDSGNLKRHMRKTHPGDHVIVKRQAYQRGTPLGNVNIMRDNADSIYSYSVTLEEQGMSCLEDLRNTQVDGSNEAMRPSQTDEVKKGLKEAVSCDMKDKDWLASRGLKEEPLSPGKSNFNGTVDCDVMDRDWLTSNGLKVESWSPGQSNDVAAADWNEKCDDEGGARWPREGVEAESSPVRNTSVRRECGDNLCQSPSTLPMSLGHASPSNSSLHGLKRGPGQLGDCEETLWNTGHIIQKTNDTGENCSMLHPPEPWNKTISGSRPSSHVCDHCGKDFVSSTNLKTHLLYLRGEKPHMCCLCGKRFVQTSCLKRHLRTHTGEKPYVCPCCGKAWSDSGNLKRHIKKTHTGQEVVVKRLAYQRNAPSGNVDEMWDNIDSVESEEQRMSWSFRLKEDTRRIPQETQSALMNHSQAAAAAADDDDIGDCNKKQNEEEGTWLPSNRMETIPMSPSQCDDHDDDDEADDCDMEDRDSLTSNRLKEESLNPGQSNYDGAADWNEKCDDEGGARWHWKGVEAEPSPVRSSAQQRGSADKLSESPSTLPMSLGHASPCSSSLHGLKMVSVQLGDCEETLWNTGHIIQKTTDTGENCSLLHPPEPWNETISGSRPSSHVCDHCGKDFVSATNLKTHLLYLRGEKPHMCCLCGKRFVQTSCLKRHLRTHTGEKPYACPRCGKAWSDSGNLKRHIRKTHPGEEVIVNRQAYQRSDPSGDGKEMQDNTYSVESGEQGMSWLLRLKEDTRRIHQEGGGTLTSHSQADDDDDIRGGNKKQNGEGIAGLPSNRQGAVPLISSQCDDDPSADSDAKDSDQLIGNRLKEEPLSPGQNDYVDIAYCHEKCDDERRDRWPRNGWETESSPVRDPSEQTESGDNLCQSPSTLPMSFGHASPSNSSLHGLKRGPGQLGDCEETLWNTGHIIQKTNDTGENCSMSHPPEPWNKTISGSRPSSHVCDHCGKDFVSSTNLKTHLLYLRGEKPHMCCLCGKRFVQTSCLKRHLRTHTGEKPYSCPCCGKAWSDSGNLKRHIRKTHPGEEVIVKRQANLRSDPSGNAKETWDNIDSMESAKLGMTWSFRLIEETRRIHQESRGALLSPCQVDHDDYGASCDEMPNGERRAGLPSNSVETVPMSPSRCSDDHSSDYGRNWLTSSGLKEESLNYDGAADRNEKCDDEGGAMWPWKGVEAEPSPVRSSAPQGESGFPSTLPMSLGHASPSNSSLHGLKRGPGQLGDCEETLWNTGHIIQKTNDTGENCSMSHPPEPWNETISGSRHSSHACDHCGKDFVSATNLKTHLLYLRGEKPHMCSLCGKSFVQTSCLKRHLRTHTGEKPYVCPRCGKAWSDSGNLKRHIRKTHPGEEVIVKRQAYQRSDPSGNVEETWDNIDSMESAKLKKDTRIQEEDRGAVMSHSQTDEEDDALSCKMGDRESLPVNVLKAEPLSPSRTDDVDTAGCKEEWDEKDRDWLASDWKVAAALKRPEQSDPPYWTQSARPHSSSGASPGTALLLDLKRVSVRLVDCRKMLAPSDHVTHKTIRTEKSPHSSSNAEQHNKTISGSRSGFHVCDHCGKVFVSLANLKTHLLYLRGEKPHICSFCGKRFVQTSGLKRHLRTHTGEKPYVCHHCGKAWSDSGNLKRHQRRTHPGEKVLSRTASIT